MKHIISRVVVALLILTVAGVSALAKTKMGTVTFQSEVRVNGTLVKKGSYDITYDEKSGELVIEKGGKVVAKTAARLENLDRKARRFEFQTRQGEMGAELVSITFDGSDKRIVVNKDSLQMGSM